MRLLLGQLAPRPGDVARNADAVCAAVAANPDVELAVFPELFLSGYFDGRDERHAIEVGDPALQRIRDAAARHATSVVVGFAERTADGLANSVACIGEDGALRAVYRKCQLFGAGERAAFQAGEGLVLTDLGGRRVGPLICFDVEFPETARVVAVGGAELLVTVAANMAPYGPDHALAARARALENRLPHIYVNRVGVERELEFVGESCVIDASGSAVAQLADEEAARSVTVDLTTDVAADVDYLRYVRDLSVQGPEVTAT